MDKMITDKMTIDLDVFSPFIEDIIMGNMNGTLVVTIKMSSRGYGHIEILKKPSQSKELRCGINKGTILCFSIGADHKGLFLTSPRNQRRAKKKAITNGGPAISGISYPISIKECMENKRRLSKVEKAMKESDFQVSKNTENSSIVSRSWSRQILAHLMNIIGNVWMNDSEINQAVNQSFVKRGIRQWFPPLLRESDAH